MPLADGNTMHECLVYQAQLEVVDELILENQLSLPPSLLVSANGQYFLYIHLLISVVLTNRVNFFAHSFVLTSYLSFYRIDVRDKRERIILIKVFIPMKN